MNDFGPTIGEHADGTLRILFVTHVTTQMRHFTGLLRVLSERGHQVTVMAEGRRGKPQRLPVFLEGIPNLSVVPTLRSEGAWGRHSRTLRATRNYYLYYHDIFKNATVFKDRSYGWVDPNLRSRMPKDRPPTAEFTHWLQRVEDSIPVSRWISRFLVRNAFDVVLVSPYIFYQNTHHLDYVKACHHLGIPVGFPVFSWDNLTTKGNVQVQPDHIWVWNQIQRDELVRLHGSNPDIISVVGAWRFDDFVSLRPSTSRKEFFRHYGFDPCRPLIAYLGSSPAIAPSEGGFVVRWLDHLRKCSDETVTRASVLIRAHPRNIEAWQSTDGLLDQQSVAFQEPDSKNLFEGQGLFDLLTHADCCVGLNTSAMLEAAIMGKAVHSVADADLAHGQEGTVHFEYLTTAGGGLLYLAESFDRHFEMIGASLRLPRGVPDARAVAFTDAFINAGGAGPVAATRALANGIESLARTVKAPQRQPLADRLRGHAMAVGIRLGLFKLLPDPDYTHPRSSSLARRGQGLAMGLTKLLDKVDPDEKILALLLADISASFGRRRAGPKTLDGAPLAVKALGLALSGMARGGIKAAKVVGLGKALDDRLGLPASQFRPDLAKRYR